MMGKKGSDRRGEAEESIAATPSRRGHLQESCLPQRKIPARGLMLTVFLIITSSLCSFASVAADIFPYMAECGRNWPRPRRGWMRPSDGAKLRRGCESYGSATDLIEDTHAKSI